MRKLLALIFVLLPVVAFASSEKPQELASVIHADAPYGEGAYTWYGIKAYDASLWTDSDKWSADSTYALSLRYNRKFANKDIVKRSIDEMDNIKSLSDDQKTDYTAQLTKVFADVKDGDTITALYVPKKGATFFYNGKKTGTLKDEDLIHQFFGIWLSEKTSAPGLRKKLLKL